MGVFDSAKIVKINNKEVESIKTADGGVIYQRPIVATITSNSVQLGGLGSQWLVTNGDVIVDLGNNTQQTVNNPTAVLSYTYGDGLNSHDITFFGKVTGLGGNCFRKCTGLTSIIIPSNVTSIGQHCFRECVNLASIVIPNSVVNLEQFCFRNCTGLTSVTIPNTITSITPSCFYNCTSLTSVTIPNSITSLESSCFNHCTSLTSVTIPNNVTKLGDACFKDCSSLSSVTIPNSVTSIGANCFNNCTALVNYQLYWTNNNIITYDSNKMPNNTNTKFYVPKGQKTNYVNKGYPSDKIVERS